MKNAQNPTMNLNMSLNVINKKYSKLVLISVLLGALTVELTGCAAVVVGGVATGATLIAVNRRTSGAQLDDEGIEIRSASRLKDQFGSRGNFNVASYNRRALITGEVGSEADKQAAEQIVAKVDNVKMVVNELTIATMTSTLSQRSNDTYLTSKVKASLLEAKDVPYNAIKVVTEREVVYLMGIVTTDEAARATEVARGVSGVSKVVRAFELVSESDIKR